MKYGKSVQLVKQEYWFDPITQKHKPGKLKGLSVQDLVKLDTIGISKIISFMRKNV